MEACAFDGDPHRQTRREAAPPSHGEDGCRPAGLGPRARFSTFHSCADTRTAGVGVCASHSNSVGSREGRTKVYCDSTISPTKHTSAKCANCHNGLITTGKQVNTAAAPHLRHLGYCRLCRRPSPTQFGRRGRHRRYPRARRPVSQRRRASELSLVCTRADRSEAKRDTTTACVWGDNFCPSTTGSLWTSVEEVEAAGGFLKTGSLHPALLARGGTLPLLQSQHFSRWRWTRADDRRNDGRGGRPEAGVLGHACVARWAVFGFSAAPLCRPCDPVEVLLQARWLVEWLW